MSFEKIGFIGLGLIGGSIAKTLKRLYPDVKLYATSGHLSTVTAAYAEHTIENNELLDMETIAGCDLIFLCTPVQKNIEYLRALKPFIQPGTIITDVVEKYYAPNTFHACREAQFKLAELGNDAGIYGCVKMIL